MPKLRGMRFTTAIIERYRRRETSVEEAMIEMCLAGVSTCRIEGVSEILWGASVSAETVSNLNEKAFEAVGAWRNRPLERAYPYVYVDGIYLKRSWGGSYENVAVTVAVGVNDDGYREVIGAAEGFTGSLECWREFKSRGLRGVRMFADDKAAGMVGTRKLLVTLLITLAQCAAVSQGQIMHGRYSVAYGSLFVATPASCLFILVDRKEEWLANMPDTIIRVFTSVASWSFSIYVIHVWVLNAANPLLNAMGASAIVVFAFDVAGVGIISYLIARVLGLSRLLRKWLLLV